MKQFDYLILGSGIAGLLFPLLFRRRYQGDRLPFEPAINLKAPNRSRLFPSAKAFKTHPLEVSLMAGIFSPASILAHQIAGTVEKAYKFLFAIQLRRQRLSNDFRLGAVQLARTLVQPVGKIRRHSHRQSFHNKVITHSAGCVKPIVSSRLCAFALILNQ
jgi:hypothetical protein